MGNTFDSIREKGLLLYEYIRGSQCYGLATETSDKDTGGVFICPQDELLGLDYLYQPEIASERQDDKWWELGKFMKLLLNCNPTVLESLFIPDDCVLYESPEMKEIRKHKEMFLTKKCFKAFGGYAVEQIRKAQGYKKKIINPVNKRLGPLDFCYTFYGQGSTKIKNWLEYRGLFQKYCGLIKIPNMHDTYGVYYDWAQHFQEEGIKTVDQIPDNTYQFILTDILEPFEEITEWFSKKKFIGYRGMIFETNSLNDLHLSSIPKGEKPICNLTYNQSGYNAHCIDYRDYQKWVKERNPERFNLNVGYQFDAKNIMHSFRLIRMCTELAQGKGFNLVRTEDRQFLLDIKTHKIPYEEIKDQLDKEKILMDEACAKSTLPDEPDAKFVNDLLLNTRKKYYGLVD